MLNKQELLEVMDFIAVTTVIISICVIILLGLEKLVEWAFT